MESLVEQFIRERIYFKNVSPATVVWYRQSFRAFDRAMESRASIGNRIAKLREAGLSAIDVARIVKELAFRAGLDPAKYAGHSLRAEHATSAAIAGASERSIMNQTGHRLVQMLRRYIREGSLFRENSAGKVGALTPQAARQVR